jgi:hypothetical protein
MAVADIVLNHLDYGQRVKIATWCSDISTAQTMWTRWKRESTGETHILPATYEEDTVKLVKYPIVSQIPTRWLKDKLGLWVVTAELRWSNPAKVNGDTVTVMVQRSPTETTTTTSTTSTTSTTTAP